MTGLDEHVPPERLFRNTINYIRTFLSKAHTHTHTHTEQQSPVLPFCGLGHHLWSSNLK